MIIAELIEKYVDLSADAEDEGKPYYCVLKPFAIELLEMVRLHRHNFHSCDSVEYCDRCISEGLKEALEELRK